MLSNVNPAYIHKYTLAWKLLPPAISVLLSLNNPTWQIAACNNKSFTIHRHPMRVILKSCQCWYQANSPIHLTSNCTITVSKCLHGKQWRLQSGQSQDGSMLSCWLSHSCTEYTASSLSTDVTSKLPFAAATMFACGITLIAGGSVSQRTLVGHWEITAQSSCTVEQNRDCKSTALLIAWSSDDVV